MQRDFKKKRFCMGPRILEASCAAGSRCVTVNANNITSLSDK